MRPLILSFRIKEKGVHHMFGRKKKEKFYVELSTAEVNLLITALMNFREQSVWHSVNQRTRGYQ